MCVHAMCVHECMSACVYVCGVCMCVVCVCMSESVHVYDVCMSVNVCL